MAQDPPRWLTEPEMRAWRALVARTTGLLATLDRELQAEHGLSLGDYEVLVRLEDAPGHFMRMTDLATALHLSPSGITRRVDGLVRAGWVDRRQCPTDRRGQNALLTDLGEKKLDECAPTHVQGVREHFIDRLSPRQLANLASALEAVELDADAAAGGCDPDD
jgi:DNA-binding MarR family transcriptional regulator